MLLEKLFFQKKQLFLEVICSRIDTIKTTQKLIDLYNLTKTIIKKGNDSEELAIAQFWDCNPFVVVNKSHFMFASKKITPGAHWIGICNTNLVDKCRIKSV